VLCIRCDRLDYESIYLPIDRIAKQHEKGKLTARERINLLLDKGGGDIDNRTIIMHHYHHHYYRYSIIIQNNVLNYQYTIKHQR
jgi:hypothetical protein